MQAFSRNDFIYMPNSCKLYWGNLESSQDNGIFFKICFCNYVFILNYINVF